MGFRDKPITPYGRLSGYAFAKGSARKVAASFIVDGRGARLEDADGVVLVEGRPASHESMGHALSLDFAETWRFETAQVAEAKRMLGRAKDDWLTDLERLRPRMAVFVVACLGLGFVTWKYGVALLAAVAIWATPPALVETIDRSNLAAIDRLLAEETTLSESDQARVREIFDDVAAAAPQAPYGPYTLHFRDMPAVGPNAFALPGGTVIVTDAMVRDYGKADILAGVFGHELAHVSERHQLDQLYRSLSTYVLVAMIAGDVGPVLEDLLLEGSALMSLSFSRASEAEADEVGVATARAAGYDPAALAEFFAALEAEYGEDIEWLSTHPASSARAARIKDLARE